MVVILKRCKKFDATYYLAMQYAPKPSPFSQSFASFVIEFPKHVIAKSYLVIESPMTIGKEKFRCKDNLPLIYVHQGFGEHQNIQCILEYQDLEMPSLVQEHHSRHIYHSLATFLMCQPVFLFACWRVAAVYFSMHA